MPMNRLVTKFVSQELAVYARMFKTAGIKPQ
jgi:hypothetical protein